MKKEIQITQAMLMCAGMGLRLKPFTQDCPKVLVPVMGIPLLQFATDGLVEDGIRRIVGNYHYLPEKMKAGFKALDLGGQTQLIPSDESELLLGSAGGLIKALPYFKGGPFFVANADVVASFDWQALAEQHFRLRQSYGVSITYTVFSKSPAGSPYTEIQYDRSTHLMTGLLPKQTHCPFFPGAAVVERDILEGLPEGKPLDFIQDVLSPAIQKKKAGVYPSEGVWLDIGQPGTWLRAHLEIIARLQSGAKESQWLNRVQKENSEIAPGVYVSNRTLQIVKESGPLLNSIRSWKGPCYWNADFEDSSVAITAPRILGPNAVFYGSASQSAADEFKDGIGFQNKWVSV